MRDVVVGAGTIWRLVGKFAGGLFAAATVNEGLADELPCSLPAFERPLAEAVSLTIVRCIFFFMSCKAAAIATRARGTQETGEGEITKVRRPKAKTARTEASQHARPRGEGRERSRQATQDRTPTDTQHA